MKCIVSYDKPQNGSILTDSSCLDTILSQRLLNALSHSGIAVTSGLREPCSDSSIYMHLNPVSRNVYGILRYDQDSRCLGRPLEQAADSQKKTPLSRRPNLDDSSEFGNGVSGSYPTLESGEIERDDRGDKALRTGDTYVSDSDVRRLV